MLLNLFFFLFLISIFFSRLNSQLFFIDIFGQLSFQILICGILLFFILIISKKLWKSIICILICSLLTIDIFSSCNHCNAFIEDESQKHNKIRLMTFNTGFIDNFKNVHELILFEKPDIIQFQEVSPLMQDKLKSLKSFFPYNIGLNEPTELFSSIILSKYPLKNKKKISNYIIYTNVLINEKELTIVGVHLFPPVNQFILNTYAYFYIKYTKAFKPRKLPKADFGIAIEQMSLLKNLFEKNKQNLIIMGDLNMTATSKRFTDFLNEINLYTYISHKHTTFTWPRFIPKFLGIQIDHVLFSENLKMIRKKTIDYSNSDHRPLLVDLAF